MNKLIITKKNLIFVSLVIPSETEKSQLIYIWFESSVLHTNFHKNYILSTLPATWQYYAITD